MSPAHTHIEQSRNTLLFATCAKEVVTNAQVNVVMSDKALLKHLQRELARLQNELKFPESASCAGHTEALKEKDEQIKKVLHAPNIFQFLSHCKCITAVSYALHTGISFLSFYLSA